MGRFINADTLTSTGQGLLGNNMFTYCLNNPVMYADDTGHWAVNWDLYENELAGTTYGESLLEQKEAIESGEVVYNRNSEPNSGAEIKNSHKIHSIPLMYQYINENRGDEVAGLTTGIVFEWVVHNLAYVYGCATGNVETIKRAGDLDIGKTIWEDDHGWQSTVMKAGYSLLLPFHADTDYQIQTNQLR